MSRIIIADDNNITRQFYSEVIGDLGHEAVICSNGKTAVKAFAEKGADLVLLDYEMPVMNGFEACREMRRNPKGINVPIIIVSAHTEEKDILEGMNAGATDYLLKPVRETHLTAKIKTYLNMGSLHREDLELVRNKTIFAGRYEVRKVLGYGAHSVVFLVKDISEDKALKALKLYSSNFNDDALAEYIIEKAQKIKEVGCDTIIQIFDHGVFEGRIYMVMEYAEGGDLSKLLKVRNLNELEAVSLMLDVAEALKSLDEAGISHFDIKPENILVSGLKFKLGDFGVFLSRDNSTMKLGAELWGTSAYIAPESLVSPVDPGISGDIYSLGVTIYEAVLGENPFKSAKPVMSMFKQLNFVPPSLSTYNVNFSPLFSQIVQKMLNKDPKNRPSLHTIQLYFGELVVLLKKLPPEKLFPIMKHKEIFSEGGNAAEKTEISENQKQQDKEVGKTTWDEVKNEVEKINKERKSLRLRPHIFQIFAFFLNMGTVMSIVLIVVLFSIFVGFGYISSKIFGKWKTEQVDEIGTYSVVTCRNCGTTSEKYIGDISTFKCESCGGEMAYALECEECRELFPMGKDVPCNIPEEKRELLLLKQKACPSCNSHFTRQVLTSKEKIKLANMKSNAPATPKDVPKKKAPPPPSPEIKLKK